MHSSWVLGAHDARSFTLECALNKELGLGLGLGSKGEVDRWMDELEIRKDYDKAGDVFYMVSF